MKRRSLFEGVLLPMRVARIGIGNDRLYETPGFSLGSAIETTPENI